ncbi:hypothetical protein HMPREF0495_01714 [Levilactobacillus brevis ATCC 14869 = DSM 20054]|uniref:Uncharacterized protein n=1 Tax=Levilactobacillus brevis ATCC 14869 = DSM 20054 TaxID=649758 RepID=U2QNU9_LEVBR|nr:hypothetical protein HMPREF0495_01714 [Levilactobacillus brevis ATCC 14869 = DSM 20054]
MGQSYHIDYHLRIFLQDKREIILFFDQKNTTSCLVIASGEH